MISLCTIPELGIFEKEGCHYHRPNISKEVLVGTFTQWITKDVYRSVSIPYFETDKLWNKKIPLSTVIALRKHDHHQKALISHYSPKKINERPESVLYGLLPKFAKVDPVLKEQSTHTSVKTNLKPQEWGYIHFELFTSLDLSRAGVPLDEAFDADIIILHYRKVSQAEEID